jgi:sorbitol-specific phosphotransferase system component IIBC
MPSICSHFLLKIHSQRKKSSQKDPLIYNMLLLLMKNFNCLFQVNGSIEKNAVRVLLPYFLYMSVLVLAIQSAAVVALLAQSHLPLGLWFLLGCIGTLVGIFCYTAVLPTAQTVPFSKKSAAS